MNPLSSLSALRIIYATLLAIALSSCGRQDRTLEPPKTPFLTQERESPLLAEQVAQGLLPPLEERLPVNPVVADTYGPNAYYGGTLRIVTSGYWAYGGFDNVVSSRLFRSVPVLDEAGNLVINEDGTLQYDLVGNLAEEWEYSEDGTTLTVRLREGLKYSDGHPFTTEDIEYRYQLWNDTEKYSQIITAPFLRIGSDPVALEVIDDLNFRFTLPQPDFRWIMEVAANLQFWETPKHWLSQYDPNFNPSANWQDFKRHLGNLMTTERPSLGPWKLVKWEDAGVMQAERNPYFYMVDKEGRQLPYIDRVQGVMIRSPDVAAMRVMSGQIDIYDGGQVQDLTLLKSGEERGGYRLFFTGEGAGSFPGLMVNFFTTRPNLGELLREQKFRKALSLGINRPEINTLVFGGFGVPTSASFGSWFTDLHSQYDPEQARSLLEELGLRDINGDGILQYPDGTDLTVVITSLSGPYSDVAELIVSHWQRVGIQAVVQNVHPNQYSVQRRNMDFDLITASDGSYRVEHVKMETWSPLSRPVDLDRPMTLGPWQPYAHWYFSNGEQGIEPPADLIAGFSRIRDLERSLRLEPDADKAMESAREVSQIWAELIPAIGVVGRIPTPLTVSDRMLNVPSVVEAPPAGYWLRAGVYAYQLVIDPRTKP